MKSILHINNFLSDSMKIVPAFLILLVMLGFSGILSPVKAQSVASLETKLNSLTQEYNAESESLKALQQNLSDKLKEIERARKSGSGENVIKNMLAGSVTVSNKIDEKQKRMNILSRDIDGIKKQLDKKYSAEIDSLTALEKSDDFKGSKNDIRTKLVETVEKRLRIAPNVQTLSFSPEKILAINPAVAKTEDEKKVLAEYLGSALSEVESQITNTKKLRAEVDQIVSLQEKTRRFLEDVEFDTDAGVSGLMASSKSATNPTSDIRNEFNSQAQSFVLLLKQLDTGVNTNSRTKDSYYMSENNKNISLKDYAAILREAEQKLDDYRTILNHRLGNSKK